jgi:tripartite-type tricarboxylate transporter receptor subunit TctC
MMKKNVRGRYPWAIVHGAVLWLGVVSSGVFAQEFPTKPIKIIVPYAAGGSTDIMARLVGAKLTDRLGQNAVVENRPGANATIGTTALARSPADGYTLAVMNMPAVSNVFVKDPQYDPEKDFDPVVGLYRTVYALAIHSSIPAKSLKEFIDYAKANKGKLNYSAHVVTAALPMEMLKNAAGIELTAIQYKGTAPGLQALMVNEVQAMFDLTGPFAPVVKDGKIRILAIAGDQRLPGLPDIPTTAELGFPKVRAGGTVALWGPAGMPAPVVNKLNAVTNDVLKLPDVLARIAGDGSVPAGSTVDDLRQRYKSEYAFWREAAAVAKYKPD